MKIDADYLKRSKCCTAQIAEQWVDALNAVFERYAINTEKRIAAFISQCGHESGLFAQTSENLNYSADSLRRVFGKYYPTQADAEAHARKPEKIGARVYGGRMGNGPEETGEGYRFRGRGLIQLTGKDNYRACGSALGFDLLANPDLVAEPELAALSAGWFWDRNGLNALADKGDVEGMTKRINGGTNGLDHRRQLYSSAIAAF
jgi:putative chitinase